MVIDDLIYGKLLDSLYPKSFLMTDEDGLQHEVIHYGDVKNAIEDFRIELKRRVGVSKMENVDTISRQAAIDIATFECGKWKGLAKEIAKQISALPPVQPERKKGEWIEISSINHTYKCSECGRILVNVTDGKNNVSKHYPYCHCGADMRGEAE